MNKSDPAGMQMQTVGGMAIECVAPDGTVQTIGMGTMEAKLMGAAGEGMKLYACPALGICAHHFVFGDGGFSMYVVDDLAWTVCGVRTQRQTDDSMLR